MWKIKWIFALLITTCAVIILKPGAVLAADATIAGTITHASDGTPIEGIFVYAENYTTGTTSYDYTAVDGTYSITIDDTDEPTAGQYTVYNYTSTSTETGTIFLRHEESVTLVEGENKTGVNIGLVRRAKLQGYVYASDGVTPIYNAYVSMVRTSAWTDGTGTDYSAASGLYTVSPYSYPDYTRSAVGEFTVTVTAYGYIGGQYTVTLSADETTTTQNFTLTPDSTVSGTVTDSNGVPLSGASVVAQLNTGGYTYSADTASDGTFTVLVAGQSVYNSSSVGNYKLTVSQDGYVNKTKSFSISAEASTLTGHDFSLQTAGTFTGTIFEDDGVTPIEDVTVTATDGLGNTYSATSDSAGLYTFANLRASSHYTIAYTVTGYVTEYIYEQSVALGETSTADDMLMEATVSFDGTVVSKTGSDPIYGATVKLFNRAKPRSSSADYSTTTLTDGTFTLTGIAPGTYRLKITQTGFVTYDKSLISLKTDKSNKTYQLSRAAAVSGRVTVNGDPVHNALVTVYSKTASDVGYGAVYTDGNGYYRIASLKPGKYTVKVSGMAYVEKVVTKKLTQDTTTVLNIKVGNAGSISGFVLDAQTGLPISGYQVRIRHQSVSAYTDANGYYIIDGLAPGTYKAYVASAVYKTKTIKHISVESGQETESMNFQLSPK